MVVTDVDEAIISVCYDILSSGVTEGIIKQALKERGVTEETISYSKEIDSEMKVELLRVFY